MKPLINCPGCNAKLVNNTVYSYIHEQHCIDRCGMHYMQYFITSIDDLELKYMRFYTKNFLVYSYSKIDLLYTSQTHIYNRVFPRGQTVQGPLLKLNDFIVDFDNIDKLDSKLKTLSIFS